MAKKIIEVSNMEEFAEAVKEGNILVYFWAPWCSPCRMVAPILDEIQEDDNGITIVKVNTDDTQDVAVKMGIRSIPTLKYYVGGVDMDTHVGAKSKKDMLKVFTRVEKAIQPPTHEGEEL